VRKSPIDSPEVGNALRGEVAVGVAGCTELLDLDEIAWDCGMSGLCSTG
jgi:hypothetical protein